MTALKYDEWNETVDLSSENLELIDPEFMESLPNLELMKSLPNLELMKSLTRLKTLRLSSAAVGQHHINSLFRTLAENFCRLQELGKGNETKNDLWNVYL